jgi:hypothetical protein
MMSKRGIALELGDNTPIRDELPQKSVFKSVNALLNQGLGSVESTEGMLASTDSAGYI